MQEAQVFGLHDRVIELLGRLYYRTSYSQNVLRHSIEVAFIAGMLAEEMGMTATWHAEPGCCTTSARRPTTTSRAAIRRLVPTCSSVSASAPRWCMPHWDTTTTSAPTCRYTVLTAAGDACSASRPGARRETLDRYIKRMQELETIATSFEGVRQAFAIQAGREVRCHRQLERHHRRVGRQDLPRHRQGLRRPTHLPGRDQGHTHSRDPNHRDGTLRVVVGGR